ncbi:MAG: dTDP-glucose 4,6-dehydratase [Aerococcus sp.]|nr:dTDP-glucose 4,6-dehydratase [Aerococcus sp.]
MNILVTGGAGFIGSHFIRLLLKQSDTDAVVNLDALTYAGNLKNLQSVENHPRYTFVHGDVCDPECVSRVFGEYQIDQVVHFAAESHVDRSIARPERFMTTNVLGTENLLNVARHYWETTPEHYHPENRFVQISTDEVYGDAVGQLEPFDETSVLHPSSPYAASKASADLMVGAYQRTYQFPALITRSSNNYGPNQYPEKWIPVVIKHALYNESIPLYGSGLQERDWIHVTDHCRGVLTVLKQGKLGEIYNIAGHTTITNRALAQEILQYLGQPESLLTHVSDRLGHDQRYAISDTKLRQIGWKQQIEFIDGLHETIDWYQSHPDWLK